MSGLASLGIDWKLLIAQAINFLILLLLLNKFLYKPIVQLLSDRKKRVEEGIRQADQAKTELDKAEVEARKMVSKAVDDAQKIQSESKKTAEQEVTKILSAAQKRAEKIIEGAKTSAAAEEERVEQAAKAKIADLVSVAVEKILEQKQDEKEIDRLIQKI
jgi:F-type H+-transporting ATPase subunit b